MQLSMKILSGCGIVFLTSMNTRVFGQDTNDDSTTSFVKLLGHCTDKDGIDLKSAVMEGDFQNVPECKKSCNDKYEKCFAFSVEYKEADKGKLTCYMHDYPKDDIV